jgi:hypothetical protein
LRKPGDHSLHEQPWPISPDHGLSRQHLFVGRVGEYSHGWMLTAIGCMMAASYPEQNGGK